MLKGTVCAAALAVLVACGAPAQGGATVMLQPHAAGSVIDFGKDGPDTLSAAAFVGQSPVDEARALLEYNLGFIAGHTVTSARVHGQIADAQNTITGLRQINIGAYTGDGATTLADWSVAAAPLGSVSYTFPEQSGTSYNLDVTAPLQSTLSAGGGFFGVQFTGTTNNGISSVTTSAPRRLDVLLANNPAPVANEPIYFSFTSQPGDWVGRGWTQIVTPANGPFLVNRNFDNGISVTTGDWGIRFAAPGDVPLAVGSYENATRWPFQAITAPGLDFSGVGRGNNESLGRFDVLDVSYGPGGEVLSFIVEFENRGITTGGNLVSDASYGRIVYAVPEPGGLLALATASLLLLRRRRANVHHRH